MPEGRLPVKNRIVIAIILPVAVVGLAISVLSINFSTPHLTAFIENSTKEELRLASGLGIGICEERLNDIVNLRLEDDRDVVLALKKEALEEIKGISAKLHNVNILVVEEGDRIVGSSLPLPAESLAPLPKLTRNRTGILSGTIGGRPVRMHYGYFPLWRWHVLSFIFESDYMQPIHLARRVVYLGNLSALVVVIMTLILVFNRRVHKPLKEIIAATEGIARGEFSRVDVKRRDEIGRVALAFNTMVDSLEEKSERIDLILSELRESEERYRLLTENSLALITMVQDGRVIYANRRAVEVSGYSHNEFLQIHVLDMIHPEDREEVGKRMALWQSGNRVVDHYEFRAVTKSGETFWLEILAVPMVYKGKSASLGHAIDITDRKAAQEEQKKLEARLQQAEKMEAIGTLAGAVAHDLNNILAGLVTYPDLLLLQIPEDSPIRKALLTIQQSGQKAAAIVWDLLTMARRGVAVREVVNLNDIILQYSRSPEFENLRKFHPGVDIRLDLDPDLPNISGSPVHLSKAVMNLVTNGAEAMPQGGKVLIETRPRKFGSPFKGYEVIKEGSYVTVAVSDTGVGISAGDITRIFEPFYTKKVMGRSGTGLGMAVVWSTVKDLEGYIDVQSIEGKGTRFELFFPVTAEHAAVRLALRTLDAYRGSETILVVDDLEEQREIASAMLGKLGYAVVAVPSGEEAVEYLRTRSVDLVVLDMIMPPGMDGLKAYQEILKLHPGQTAVITSGYAETDLVREAQRLGAGKYISKPYTMEILAAAIRAELDKPRCES